MHHIHISTGFMFVAALFTVGFVGVVLAFVASIKKDRREADVALESAKLDAAYRAANPVRPTAEQIQQVHGERLAARQAVNGQPFMTAPAPVHTHTISGGYVPSAAAAPVYVRDPLTGLATGMMLGSMMGHHDTTTIIHDAPAPSYYSEPAPSYSSSSSSDSGFSYSDSSSSSSYDSGSSGGFDASW
jgi:hypothetical protein